MILEKKNLYYYDIFRLFDDSITTFDFNLAFYDLKIYVQIQNLLPDNLFKGLHNNYNQFWTYSTNGVNDTKSRPTKDLLDCVGQPLKDVEFLVCKQSVQCEAIL